MDRIKKEYEMIKVLLLGPFVVNETNAVHFIINHINIVIDLVSIKKLDEMID